MYKSQMVGKLGEDIASLFLMKRGFEIIERNYRRKMGEIDIIAQKGSILHFCEVKAVTRETVIKTKRTKRGNKKESNLDMDITDEYRPEDNVHRYKQKKLAKVIQLYLVEKHKNRDVPWEFCVICVELNEQTKIAHVRRIPNVILAY